MPIKVQLETGSNDDVSKVPQELTESRQRLEAGVEANRRNREVIQGLADQIQKIRQRASEKDAMMAGTSKRRMGGGGDSGRQNLNSIYQPSSELSLEATLPAYSPSQLRVSPMHRSSPLLNRSFDVDRHSETININIDPSLFGKEREEENEREIEGLINKLKAELFKNNTLEEINEMLKAENDAALSTNVNLRADVSELTRTLEVLSKEYRDEQERFRIENQRYRSHLDTQHRQLIALWKAFLAVKRQMKDLRSNTATDLEKQMSDFAKCTQMMQQALRHAENRTSSVQNQMNREKDEAMSEIFNKFDELSERNAEVEKQNSEKTRRISRLETELRREKEEKETMRETLGKISMMPELAAQNDGAKPRARSTSPGSPLSGNEAMRKVRAALHVKSVELKDLQMKIERSEAQSTRLQREMERFEKEIRQRTEREHAKDEEIKKKDVEKADFEKQARRVEEKLQKSEEERERQQQNVQQLQESIAHIHKLHKEFIENLTERHREEMENRQKHQQEENDERMNEEKTKTQRLKDELDRLRFDCDATRQQYRDLQAEAASLRKGIEDRDMTNHQIEDELKRVREQLGEAQAGEDEKDKRIQELKAKYEHAKDKEKRIKGEMAELAGTNEILAEENRSLQEQNSEHREQINEMGNRLEQSSQREDELNQQADELNTNIEKNEETMKELRANLQEAQARADAIVDEMASQREQFAYAKAMVEQRRIECEGLEKEREQAKRDKDALEDEMNGKNHEIAALNTKISTMEKEIHERLEQDHQVKLLMDEIRAKNAQLERETSEKNAIIEDMRDKLEDLHNDLIKKEEKSKAEMARVEEVKTIDIKTVREEWTQKVRLQEADMESLKKSVLDLEDRCKGMTAEIDALKAEKERTEIDLDEMKEKIEDERKRLKKKIEELEEQIAVDRDEFEEVRAQDENRRVQALDEVKNELKRVEKELNEAQEREEKLGKDLGEAKEEAEKASKAIEIRQDEMERLNQLISQLEQQLDFERKQLQAKSPSFTHQLIGDHVHGSPIAIPNFSIYEKHRETYDYYETITETIEIEEHELRLAKSQTQIDEMDRKRETIDAEKERLMEVIAKKSQSIASLEAQLDEMTSRVAEAEVNENSLRDELALFTREASELRHAVDRAQQQVADRNLRCEELEQRSRELQKEVHARQIEADHRREEADEAIEARTITQNKLQALELQLADKTAKLESTTDLLKKLENTEKHMMTELKEDAEKVTHYRRRNEELKMSNVKLSEELGLLKSNLERKTQQSQRAITDLLDNYKEAERKAHDHQVESDQLKATVLGLQAKLERADRKRIDLEAQVSEIEKRRDELAARANQYERSAAMAIMGTGSKGLPIRSGHSSDLIHDPDSPYGSLPGIQMNIPNLRGSVSTHDVSSSISVERSVHFDESADSKLRNLGVTPSVDITIRYLKERIEHLETEKLTMISTLHETKENEKKNRRRLEEVTQLLDSLQRKTEQIETEKKSLESRLNNQRQIYLSNEEAMRSRENEFRNLKAKLMSAELHVREKESKIQQLAAQIDSQKMDLLELGEERRKIDFRVLSLEKELKDVEEDRDKGDLERSRLTLQFDNLQQDITNLRKQLSEIDSVNEQQRRQMEEMRRNEEKRREIVERAQAEERHWRNTAVAAKKTSEEYHRSIYEERLSNLQRTYDTLHTAHEQLQALTDRLRQELKDSVNKVNTGANRLRETENRLEDEGQKRKNVEKTLQAMQKLETEWQKVERELRDELKGLRKEKLANISEIEELKRRIARFDVERREIEAARARLEREVAALKKHLDSLEEDKSRTEEAVKNTLAERRAMDKSLAAMEKENSELYRNCTQLQTQIQQLERDTGTKSVTKMLKEHAELEARLGKMLQEKRQLELLLEQKEMNYAHKRKLLESQLGLLREQLEAERRRRAEQRSRPTTGSTPIQQRITETKYDYQRTRAVQMRPFK
ncbi:unnamed protein product, partial [Mesorhabditis belari]|uniref:Rootletin-like coiled-coil domain-containing protein n=1 Tax=Mesorhabditis belari TaxID=2138241 RepID=A0AAF3EF06_9BILA